MSYVQEVCVCQSLFAYLPVPGYMGYSQAFLLVIVKNSAMNICAFVHKFLGNTVPILKDKYLCHRRGVYSV